MPVFLNKTPLGTNAPDEWVYFQSAYSNADGSLTFIYPNGTLLSVQPDGTWSTRAIGWTPGAYEKGTPNGNVATFNPNGDQQKPPFNYLMVNSIV